MLRSAADTFPLLVTAGEFRTLDFAPTIDEEEEVGGTRKLLDDRRFLREIGGGRFCGECLRGWRLSRQNDVTKEARTQMNTLASFASRRGATDYILLGPFAAGVARQFEPCNHASSSGSVEGYRAIVQIGKIPHDRETEPRSWHPLVSLDASLQNELACLGVKTRPVVFNADEKPVVKYG